MVIGHKHDGTLLFTWEAISALSEHAEKYAQQHEGEWGYIGMWVNEEDGIVDLPAGRFPGCTEWITIGLQRLDTTHAAVYLVEELEAPVMLGAGGELP
jgi:hypothetical protein